MSNQLNMPGGQLATRPLHFYWVCDVSSSMKGRGKIEQLNYAIREALPLMKNVATQNPNAQVFARTLAFGSGAKWMNSSLIPIEQYSWTDLSADGVTDMGAALKTIAEELKVPPMPKRALPPVIVLISDGHPTDDFDKGLRALMGESWGNKAVRIAIAIGADADTDVLRRFIGFDEIALLNASNPQQLINYIKWASTEVLQYASREYFSPDQTSDSTPALSSQKPTLDVPTFKPPQIGPPNQINTSNTSYNDLVW
ncbi:vWA domain-containing protein [Methanospirillum stamsii]|nr:tellurium resistance protein [Methanospirillum stamsii]